MGPMNKQQIIDHFGSVIKTAKALGVTHQAVYAWKDPVPERIALKAERLSGGKLRYLENLYQ